MPVYTPGEPRRATTGSLNCTVSQAHVRNPTRSSRALYAAFSAGPRRIVCVSACERLLATPVRASVCRMSTPIARVVTSTYLNLSSSESAEEASRPPGRVCSTTVHPVQGELDRQFAGPASSRLIVVPRIGTTSPWSSKATDIPHLRSGRGDAASSERHRVPAAQCDDAA